MLSKAGLVLGLNGTYKALRMNKKMQPIAYQHAGK